MRTLLRAGVAAIALLAPLAAHATVITVTPSVAPNVFGSPSWNGYVANAIAGLYSGQSTYGDPSLPTYYAAQSNVRADEVIVTGFPSWRGHVDPGTTVGPAFAGEYGNRMHFGVVIDGQGAQFSISQLAFFGASSDPANVLGVGFAYGAGDYDYSASYVGVLAGQDGQLWTADDQFVTSGPNTTLVDGLVGRGSGNSIPAYCSGCSFAQQQAAILAAADSTTHPFTFTGTYSLGDVSGSGTFHISAVPEPSTWALSILGFGLVGAAARGRRLAVRLQTA